MTNSEGSRASQRRMVEGESSNARERRLKCKPIWRNDSKMEESDAEEYVYSEEESEREIEGGRRTKKRNDPISSESEQGEFEIGVNLVQEEGMALQVKKEVMRLRVKRKEKR
ncbi:unnamed protein product [Microthlaspi erraticum]|uniref:Uncharacterized protein n=1 Tax=Microthlaspi erraticum TaxID=1685480 RepID=A0A6D2HZI0_9BRAS|nr:unnamed protein product [Microthlaspi erraticum]